MDFPQNNKTLNEPITMIVLGAVKLGIFLASVDWSKIGWDEKKATEDLIDSWVLNNNLWLYPATNVGGPWPFQTGAGRLKTMDQDALRYFIEWRIPVYKKYLQGKDWGSTKARVVNRYNIAIEGLRIAAIEVYEKRFGPYQDSGLYSDLVAAFPVGSSDVSKSASWVIKKPHSGGISLPKTNQGASSGGLSPSGGLSNTVSMGELTVSKGTPEQLKNYLRGGAMPDTSPSSGGSQKASMDWLGYTAAAAILLGLGRKFLTNKGTKTKAGLNAPVEVSL